MDRYSITTNFLLILSVKKFENWSIFDEVIRGTKMCHFWRHPVYIGAISMTEPKRVC